MAGDNLRRWLEFHAAPDDETLHDLLHEDAVFHSPVVHTPQAGRRKAHAYLSAASGVLFPADFSYLRQFDCGDRAVLEFQCVIDGTVLNGVDMIQWDDDGLIVDFKVMLRPAKALPVAQEHMAAWLTDASERGAAAKTENQD